ncbi:MAG: flagellar biosynthesis anti-sigma factor FlgM [Betaproteobacteria bacterium]|nr:flagellar biosynthesis anti-sigma factor FlgM [Betaproteobacteria bacterium]MCL2885307.1 flagellar biosynthesis anti-sigma factor FlgM [Betaproteobacteria bacterium]
MKIDSSYKPAAAAIAPKAPAAQTAPAAGAKEAVQLSPLAGSLRGGEAPPVNAARIAEIKQAISEGRFKINPEAIADRLIESARDLVSASRREA